jgi:hypothetical protein
MIERTMPTKPEAVAPRCQRRPHTSLMSEMTMVSPVEAIRSDVMAWVDHRYARIIPRMRADRGLRSVTETRLWNWVCCSSRAAAYKPARGR